MIPLDQQIGTVKPTLRFASLGNYFPTIAIVPALNPPYPPFAKGGVNFLGNRLKASPPTANTSMPPNLIQAAGIKYSLPPHQQGFCVGGGDALTGRLRQRVEFMIQ